jgi:hypothetical protein
MVTTPRSPARTRKVARQSRWFSSRAVSGANTVLANPAAMDRMVSARTRRCPYQRVSAAKAGGYSTSAWATPVSSQAATNHGRVGAAATDTMATTPSTEPMVITHRGPCRSSRRPTGTPAAADTTDPAENAPIAAALDQPVSRAMAVKLTGKA